MILLTLGFFMSIEFFLLFIKVWWHDATLFRLFLKFYSAYSTCILSQSSVCIRWGSSPFPHRWSAEPRIELGPALQQADALPAELRRTLSYAAPFIKMYRNVHKVISMGR